MFTNEKGDPKSVLDADGFIRSALFNSPNREIEKHLHSPLIITDEETNLDMIIKSLKNGTDPHSDHPIEKDFVLFWSPEYKRIITGADILGRLLKGI